MYMSRWGGRRKGGGRGCQVRVLRFSSEVEEGGIIPASCSRYPPGQLAVVFETLAKSLSLKARDLATHISRLTIKVCSPGPPPCPLQLPPLLLSKKIAFPRLALLSCPGPAPSLRRVVAGNGGAPPAAGRLTCRAGVGPWGEQHSNVKRDANVGGREAQIVQKATTQLQAPPRPLPPLSSPPP